jgi:hypothetical protein
MTVAEADPMTKDDLTRIYFRLDPTDWHGRSNEGLWAEPLERAAIGAAFRLRNSPFFFRGVSFLDIVRAAPSADGQEFEFAGVVDHSGHSTYMILAAPECPEFEAYWSPLERLGCTYESKSMETSMGSRILYSVDVPASADIYAVYDVLKKGEQDNAWMFQEGHVGHKLKS